MQIRPELYVNLRMWDLTDKMNVTETDSIFLEHIRQKLNLNEGFSPEFSKDRRSIPLAGRLYLHGSTQFEWPASAQNGTEADDQPAFCHGASGQIAVLVDGTVVPCCLDSEGEIALGNLDDQPLQEILNAPRTAAIRNGFRMGIAVEQLCKRCTFRKRHATRPKHA